MSEPKTPPASRHPGAPRLLLLNAVFPGLGHLVAGRVRWALALAASPVRAQRPDTGEGKVRHRPQLLAGAAWLAARLDSAGVVVIQVGASDASYRAGHIPGARFLPVEAVAAEVGGLSHEFPPAAGLAATFGALGVGDRTRVVLYGDDPGLLAARAWVALDLLGHGDRAAVLDGGLARWRAEGRPLQTAAPRVVARRLTIRGHPDRVVTAAWVRAHRGDPAVLLVDARAGQAFAGPGGHLPGAKNLYWVGALVSPADPVLRPMHVLHETLWKPTGADQPAVRTIVVYCNSGMQASADYFVARYVGYPDVRLYDGSMEEWTRLGYPVER